MGDLCGKLEVFLELVWEGSKQRYIPYLVPCFFPGWLPCISFTCHSAGGNAMRRAV